METTKVVVDPRFSRDAAFVGYDGLHKSLLKERWSYAERGRYVACFRLVDLKRPMSHSDLRLFVRTYLASNPSVRIPLLPEAVAFDRQNPRRQMRNPIIIHELCVFGILCQIEDGRDREEIGRCASSWEYAKEHNTITRAARLLFVGKGLMKLRLGRYMKFVDTLN